MKSKKFIIASVLFIFSAMLFAQDKMANNIDNTNIALQGYSPVSYVDLGLAQKGVKDQKSTYNSISYYFTSAEQKASFDKSPAKYLPQYGGYCAYGIYIGAKLWPDPNKFILKNGQYFLFLYNIEHDAQELWLAEKDHDKLKAKADLNWKSLSKTYN